jgi:hypothetical protein
MRLTTEPGLWGSREVLASNFLTRFYAGFWTSSNLPAFYMQKTQRFGNGMSSSSGVEGKTPTLLGPIERASPNYWTQQSRRPPPRPLT